jgi:molecular chaperone GrpE
MKNDNVDNTDDVVFEPEQESKGSFGGDAESQIKKLKKKLKEAELQAKENLDGWQRLKADLANNKKEEANKLERAKANAVEEILQSLFPVLDSFDSAMQADSWASIDKAWRDGMEFVYTQLIKALEQHNIKQFGKVGDKFDTESYDAAEGDGDIVTRVLRKGYKLGDSVIRPARVSL